MKARQINNMNVYYFLRITQICVLGKLMSWRRTVECWQNVIIVSISNCPLKKKNHNKLCEDKTKDYVTRDLLSEIFAMNEKSTWLALKHKENANYQSRGAKIIAKPNNKMRIKHERKLIPLSAQLNGLLAYEWLRWNQLYSLANVCILGIS